MSTNRLFSLLLLLIINYISCQGPADPTLETGGEDDTGIVYVMLFVLMMINTFTPIGACIYQRYGKYYTCNI